MLKGNILFCGFLIGFCELIFEFILGGNLSSDSYRNFQKNHATPPMLLRRQIGLVGTFLRGSISFHPSLFCFAPSGLKKTLQSNQSSPSNS